MQRLVYVDAARSLGLFDEALAQGGSRVQNALASLLARVANRGYLDTAAGHFPAVVPGTRPAFSVLGTRAAASAKLRVAIPAGADTFPCAFGPARERADRARRPPLVSRATGAKP